MSTSAWGPHAPPAAPDDAHRFGVRCPRCARTQPVMPVTSRGPAACVYCGAPMPVRRWRAHPPPGSGIPRRVRLVRTPYTGPPRYGSEHPRWGFPPVVWRSATVTGEDAPGARVRALLPVSVLAAVTALACLTAAGAEAWRFALLLAGRTAVLDGHQVHASDLLVTVAGLVALALGVLTALCALPVLVALHRAVPERCGRRPSRRSAAVVGRLVVPGWNLYGAGQVLAEIVAGLRRIDRRRRFGGVLVGWWWLCWVANGLLVLATLIMAFFRSNQAMANTVELHIAVDLVGALVAGLLSAILIWCDRAWSGRGSSRYVGWTVAPPASTAANLPSASPSADDGADGSGGDGAVRPDGDGADAAGPGSADPDGDGADAAGPGSADPSGDTGQHRG